MVVVNPPWQLDRMLETALAALHRALGTRTGKVKVEWLVPEATSQRA